MSYIELEELALEKVFKNKEIAMENEVLKKINERIEKQVKEVEKEVVNIDEFKKVLYLMEVKSEILLIKIYLDGLNDFNDLEKVFNNEDLRSHIRNFNLVEIYNEIYNDDRKGS